MGIFTVWEQKVSGSQLTILELCFTPGEERLKNPIHHLDVRAKNFTETEAL